VIQPKLKETSTTPKNTNAAVENSRMQTVVSPIVSSPTFKQEKDKDFKFLPLPGNTTED
jgi:hypothetical protein